MENGLILMGDLPRKYNGLIVMGDLPSGKEKEWFHSYGRPTQGEEWPHYYG